MLSISALLMQKRRAGVAARRLASAQNPISSSISSAADFTGSGSSSGSAGGAAFVGAAAAPLPDGDAGCVGGAAATCSAARCAPARPVWRRPLSEDCDDLGGPAADVVAEEPPSKCGGRLVEIDEALTFMLNQLSFMTPIDSRSVISHMSCWSRTSSLALERGDAAGFKVVADRLQRHQRPASSLMRHWLVRQDQGGAVRSTRPRRFHLARSAGTSAVIFPLARNYITTATRLAQRVPKEDIGVAPRFHRRLTRARAFAAPRLPMPHTERPSYCPPACSSA